MTNEFKILWFEDETTWYTMESRKVSSYLKNTYTLTADLKRETGANFNVDILKTENRYDLIVMDYKLAAGNTGERIIKLIRNDSILTDVLLYSSQYQDMVDALIDKNPLIDGVYFADRKNPLFEAKLYGVIRKIVRRSEDIVNLRGFFLDNTSDFEIRIKELIKLSWDKLPKFRDELESCMNSILDGILQHDEELVNELRKEKSVYMAANNHKYALSIRYRLQIISKIIEILLKENKLDIPDKFSDIQKLSQKYTDEISVYRNALSHKKFSETSIAIKGRIVPVDEELHQILRGTINKYDAIIEHLEKSIEVI